MQNSFNCRHLRASGRRFFVTSTAATMAAGDGAAQVGSGRRRIVLWFRNDLRLRDNAIVQEAVTKIKAQEYDEVVPIYCYDPRFFALSRWGNSKTGAHRAAFLQESVADLRASLRGVGSELLVAVGKPEEVLPAALEGAAQGGGLVLAQEEVASEELAVDAKVARALKVWAVEELEGGGGDGDDGGDWQLHTCRRGCRWKITRR